MESIPTLYNGTQFRSKLEAQWATLFDAIHLKWVYEPEGFTDGKIHYLPDFWLPECHSRGELTGVYFEVKPNSHARSDDAVGKAEMLAKGSRKPVIVVMTNPPPFGRFEEFKYSSIDSHTYDSYLEMAMCEACGAIDIGFYSSDEPDCSCNAGRFNTSEPGLIAALSAFSNYARWTPKA